MTVESYFANTAKSESEFQLSRLNAELHYYTVMREKQKNRVDPSVIQSIESLITELQRRIKEIQNVNS